jgi:DNA-binding beta-propeller fold protein YncE
MLLVGAVGLALFGVSLWMWWGYRLSSRTARTVLVLLMGGLVFAYCVRSTILLNYDHPDTAVEPMIYTQTTPEIPLFVQRIARLGRDIRDTNKIAPASSPNGLPPIDPDPGNIKGLPIFVSGEVANPFNWYFREYNDITWGQVKNDPGTTSPIDKLSDARGNNFVVIMVSAGENTSALQQELAGQYTSHQYKLRWNFPEDESGYGGLGYDPPDDPREYRIAVKDIINTRWDLILRSFTEQPYAGRLWRYLMYRQLWLPLPSFDMVAYIRNDVDPQFNATAPANPVPGLPTLPALTAGSNLPALDLTASSSAGVGDGQYNVPRNVAVAPNGDILVLDSLNGRVQRFDKDGKFLSKFGSVGTGDGQFTLPKAQLGPGGIAVDEDGNIYVTDTWGYRIEKFDKDGKLLLKWGEGVDTKGDPAQNQQALTGFYGPRSIAYDRAAGELYITDTGNRRVMVFNKQGQYVRQFGSSGSGPGQFDEPVSVALSPDGKVYVADLRNKRIQILDKQGAYLGQISMPQWQEADLSEPYLAFDAQGQLYASIPTSGSVVRLDASGQITATYNTTNGANLQNPIGLAFDSDGNLYVADGRRSAIVKIKPQ